jgi:hypothetical protein
MGLRMIEPWTNPRSDMYWFRRRVPVNLVAFMGRRELKFSLNTRDWDEAVLRCNEENLKLERMWHEHLHGRTSTELTQIQVAALAGEFYRETIAAHRDNPGRRVDWQLSLERHEKKKKSPIGLLSLGTHYRFAFGGEANAFLQKRWSRIRCGLDQNISPVNTVRGPTFLRSEIAKTHFVLAHICTGRAIWWSAMPARHYPV